MIVRQLLRGDSGEGAGTVILAALLAGALLVILAYVVMLVLFRVGAATD